MFAMVLDVVQLLSPLLLEVEFALTERVREVNFFPPDGGCDESWFLTSYAPVTSFVDAHPALFVFLSSLLHDTNLQLRTIASFKGPKTGLPLLA